MTSEGKGSRRNFLRLHTSIKKLRGLAAPDTAPDTASPAAAGGELAQTELAEGGGYLLEISCRAMATEFQIYLDAIRHKQNTQPALEALGLLESLESQLTVYREHSQVMDINRRAASGPVKVETGLYGLLQLAVDLYADSGGAFDITSGPLSKLWGFYRRRGQFPDQVALEEALTRVGTRWIELDDSQQSVRFAKRGVEINVNSLGKGYALDRIAARLTEQGLDDFLIHGGQSSILVRGSRQSTEQVPEASENPEASQAPAAPRPEGWRVALRHPLKRTQRVAEIRLRNRALGTSGTGMQFFHHKGRRYGHILDPRTGWPVEGMLSATALAPTAALADALSTAFFVMGPDPVQEYCSRHPDVSAILICPGKRSGTIDVHTCGLADDDLERLDT
jgi:thiamine biosynthesis lipoprotein